jgi:hypothetical protein
MKRLYLRTCLLCAIALALLPCCRSAAASPNRYCSGCTAAIAGAAVGIGVGVVAGIYLIHHNHTSLTGCVQQAGNGLSLTAKDGSHYELVNPPSDLKAGERFSLRGHKVKAASGSVFRVDTISRDRGACTP